MSTKRAQSTCEADIRALLERWAKAVRDAGWFDLDEVTVTQGDSVAFATALIR